MRLHILKTSRSGGQASPHLAVLLNGQPTTSKNIAENAVQEKRIRLQFAEQIDINKGGNGIQDVSQRCLLKNGGQGSCFLPKTDKQVSHSDSDELTPGSSVRRVINVAYLLGTELSCVFSAHTPQKKKKCRLSRMRTFIFLIGSHHYCYIHFLSPRGPRNQF